jgi:hypothetical protein
MSDLVYAVKNHRAARGGQEEARGFYEGNVAELIDNPRLRALFSKGEHGYKLNFARIVVTSRLNRLEMSSVSSPDDAQAELLAYLWKRNLLSSEIHDTHEGFLSIGEAYVVVLPAEDSDDERDVDIWFNDAAQMRVFYQEENPRKKKFAVKQWLTEDEKTRVNLYYPGAPGRIERYISISKLGPTVQDSDFVQYTDDDDAEWPEPLPVDGELPIFHLRTKRTYGRPEHKEAFGPQNGVNKLVATMMGSVDYQGLPQRYALQEAGTTSGDSDVSEVDEDFGDEVNADETKDPDLKSSPGSMWLLRGIKSVGQLDSAKPEVYLEPWRELVNAMSTTTDTPMHVFKAGGQMPTGESRRAAEMPLTNRVRDLQRIATPEWLAVFSYALRLAGVTDPQVVITWKNPSTYDDKDVWDAAGSQLKAGVHPRQVLLERGYTDEQITTWGIPEFAEAVTQ